MGAKFDKGSVERALNRHGVEWHRVIDANEYVITTSLGDVRMSLTAAYFFCLGMSTKEHIEYQIDQLRATAEDYGYSGNPDNYGY